MHGDARGLVEHKEIVVFIKNGARDALAPKGGDILRRTGGVGKRRQAQLVASRDAQLRLGALLVHPHLAAAQHLINAAFRQRRITLAQKIIEPLPGVIRRDRQKMNPGNIH